MHVKKSELEGPKTTLCVIIKPCQFCHFLSTERLYNVDEEHLESQWQRYQALAEEVERLEKESHKVSWGHWIHEICVCYSPSWISITLLCIFYNPHLCTWIVKYASMDLTIMFSFCLELGSTHEQTHTETPHADRPAEASWISWQPGSF